MFVQIADAVIVARNLGATLVVPDIRGSQPGDKRLVLPAIRDLGLVHIVNFFTRIVYQN